MNILLLNAGAKNHGATQEILELISNEIPHNATTHIVCLGDLNIQYCKGCKVCYNTCKCVQDDDMESVIEKIDASDIIIIAAPSYWADVPGQFKVFIDRCTVYSETNPNPNHRVLKKGKKCYAIALRMGTNPVECEHIIDTIAHWCGHMKVDMTDSMYFCDIKDKSTVSRHEMSIREKAREWLCEQLNQSYKIAAKPSTLPNWTENALF